MEGRVITAKMIAGFREHLILEERSAATIQKYIRDVKAFCGGTSVAFAVKFSAFSLCGIWWGKRCCYIKCYYTERYVLPSEIPYFAASLSRLLFMISVILFAVFRASSFLIRNRYDVLRVLKLKVILIIIIVWRIR